MFLGVKDKLLSQLHLFPDLLDLNPRLYTNILTLYSFCDIIKNKENGDYMENLGYSRAFNKALAALLFGIACCYDISNV